MQLYKLFKNMRNDIQIACYPTHLSVVTLQDVEAFATAPYPNALNQQPKE